jgi:hypothetical protein
MRPPPLARLWATGTCSGVESSAAAAVCCKLSNSYSCCRSCTVPLRSPAVPNLLYLTYARWTDTDRRQTCILSLQQSPTFYFEFVPIPRPYPSTTTYAHPCPPIAWHVPTHVHPCYSNCVRVLPAYTKSWLDQRNKRSFIIDDGNPEHFLVSVFLASEKFDSDLELDAGMHKTDAHPCPPMNNNITPMPTQNPWHGWAWVWAPNGGLRLTNHYW